jgi:hypothetical protein
MKKPAQRAGCFVAQEAASYLEASAFTRAFSSRL